MMRTHILEHVPFENCGSIAAWLEARRATVTRTRFYAAESLPEPAGLDLVVAMGGPMSVNDEAELPWLKQEKAFVREVIRAGAPLLGICLGAQLIASALGARVYANPVREIGWFEVEGGGSGGLFPENFTPFHWHGETFDLPPGARCLAGNAACANQAFAIGDRCLGMQFHLEITNAGIEALIGNCGAELAMSGNVQPAATIRAGAEKNLRHANLLMEQVLERLTGRDGLPVASGCGRNR